MKGKERKKELGKGDRIHIKPSPDTPLSVCSQISNQNHVFLDGSGIQKHNDQLDSDYASI